MTESKRRVQTVAVPKDLITVLEKLQGGLSEETLAPWVPDRGPRKTYPAVVWWLVELNPEAQKILGGKDAERDSASQ